MYSAFGLALALAFGAAPPFNGPPQPTKEQLKLVELMGDDSYHVREKANKDLEAMGWKAEEIEDYAGPSRKRIVFTKDLAPLNGALS